jgi:hypothetical protein
MNPADVKRYNISEGTTVHFTLDGRQYGAELRINDEIPVGVALVPRSLGLPVNSPVAIEFVSK